MTPRFMKRIDRQSEILRGLFGEPQFDPPPYPASQGSRTASMASSQYESMRFPAPPGYSRASATGSTIGIEQLSVPLDSLILVTGANSLLGMHIVDKLLEHGYRVRGAVRNTEKAIKTSKFFEQRHGLGRYHAAQVTNMATQGAFDVVMQHCVGVVHVASVTTLSSDPNEVITPSIAGAINALEAAAKEDCVRRFVYCSSVTAAVSPNRIATSEVTSESWNMLDFDDAWAPPPYEQRRPAAVHASAKMQTEAAMWRWYARRKPGFVLNTVLPATLFGHILDPAHGLPPSISLLDSLHDSRNTEFPPPYAVDVEDAALLHVAAIMISDVKDQRIFAASPQYKAQSMIQLLRALDPRQGIWSSLQHNNRDAAVLLEVDKAEELLRRLGREGWTDWQGSVGGS